MQTVSSAFTAEAEDVVRKPAHSLQVAWNKHTNTAQRTFTIGISTIGGSDLIGLEGGSLAAAGIYQYHDESDYVMRMAWEQGLNLPLGGLVKGAGEYTLDNTSGRFLPDYIGGSGALFTSAGLERRPFMISAGFEVNGVEQTLPQFAGLTQKAPDVNLGQRTYSAYGFDYVDFLGNRNVDRTAVFTGETTDVLIETLLNQAGLTTAQYELEPGLNTVPFAYFEPGDKLDNILDELVKSEAGHMFQDEEGVYHFWNRHHWFQSPYDQIQLILPTSQVINSEVSPRERFDNIINVVEVNYDYWEKRPSNTIFYFDYADEFNSGEPIPLPANTTTEVWLNFDDPVLQFTPPVNYFVYTQKDFGSTDITSSVTLDRTDLFSTSAKLTFTNNSSSSGYILYLEAFGRLIVNAQDLYTRGQDNASITAYEEHPVSINNRFIQTKEWADSYIQILLQQFANPVNIQKLTIRALPYLQMGDLISWQGTEYRVLSKKTRYDVGGFIQELIISSSAFTTTSYFTIGISTIGGSDLIA